MQLKVYDNYSASVVKIKAHIELPKLNNLVHTNIFGNLVLINRNSTPVGTVGLFFPLEAKLNADYLSANNLYRDPTKNKDQTQKGYFEDSGRVKCAKFQGHQSMGFFMPLNSLDYLKLGQYPELGSEFNDIDSFNICKKYVPIQNMNQRTSEKAKPRTGYWFNHALSEPKSVLIDNQVKLHYDTSQFGKNVHIVNLTDDILHITAKLHGTSGASHHTLAKKPLNWLQRLFIKFGIPIIQYEYSNLYNTRNTIKNHLLNREPVKDVWWYANEAVKDYLLKGMSFYYEIVGYQPNGKYVQQNYDYGCIRPTSDEFIEGTHFKVFIYRITLTNPDGFTHEFTPKQVQQFCNENGLKAVPELQYTFARNLATSQDELLSYLQNTYLEFDDKLCANKVPDEGIVIKINNGERAYKLKSFRFFEHETKQLNQFEQNDNKDNASNGDAILE